MIRAWWSITGTGVPAILHQAQMLHANVTHVSSGTRVARTGLQPGPAAGRSDGRTVRIIRWTRAMAGARAGGSLPSANAYLYPKTPAIGPACKGMRVVKPARHIAIQVELPRFVDHSRVPRKCSTTLHPTPTMVSNGPPSRGPAKTKRILLNALVVSPSAI